MKGFNCTLLACGLILGPLLVGYSFAAEKEQGRIEGMVVASETNQPLGDVTITFEQHIRGKKGGHSTRAVTDPAGKFLVTLPRGLYRYSIEKPGFSLRYGSLTVGGQGPNRITFQLDREAIITGRLVDASGKPLAGITVSIVLEQRGVSDQEGRFEIRGVGAGWHNVIYTGPLLDYGTAY